MRYYDASNALLSVDLQMTRKQLLLLLVCAVALTTAIPSTDSERLQEHLLAGNYSKAVLPPGAPLEVAVSVAVGEFSTPNLDFRPLTPNLEPVISERRKSGSGQGIRHNPNLAPAEVA